MPCFPLTGQPEKTACEELGRRVVVLLENRHVPRVGKIAPNKEWKQIRADCRQNT